VVALHAGWLVDRDTRGGRLIGGASGITLPVRQRCRFAPALPERPFLSWADPVSAACTLQGRAQRPPEAVPAAL